ncbi:hypothetical protein [Micromonospora sp. WMMD736]|uniref:hypothetical protein n=1 Tax=Micromonospora sp. WMMD736 TaxID=3404112 RepID=UPI003B9599B1
MIKIEVRPEDIPPAWLEKASALTAKLKACRDDGDDVPEKDRLTAAEKRKKIIDDNSRMWSELKNVLLRWSYQKCWYSELREDGSDYHVDHFRPKGRVANDGEPMREGYWWLAFDWLNYRIAVSYANSPHRSVAGDVRGKRDQFPLAPGNTPAGVDEDLSAEIPVLLDPLSSYDVMLIDFDEMGMPVPAAAGWNGERVRVTTRLLHLDAVRMVEARQRVWRECEEALQRAAEAISVPAGEHRRRDDKTAEDWIALVCRMLRPDAPLSAVARACVAKSMFPWARKLPSHPAAQLQRPSSVARAGGS